MDTVSTFVEDEDDDGAPETYYYSSEGERIEKGGREPAQLPRHNKRLILPRNYSEGKSRPGRERVPSQGGTPFVDFPSFLCWLNVTSS